jgi:hypothetical protein
MTDLEMLKTVLDNQQISEEGKEWTKISYTERQNPTNSHLIDLHIDSHRILYVFLKESGSFVGLINLR